MHASINPCIHPSIHLSIHPFIYPSMEVNAAVTALQGAQYPEQAPYPEEEHRRAYMEGHTAHMCLPEAIRLGTGAGDDARLSNGAFYETHQAENSFETIEQSQSAVARAHGFDNSILKLVIDQHPRCPHTPIVLHD
jgi:hypothetical protein